MTCQSWKCLPTVGPGTCLFPIRALPTEPRRCGAEWEAAEALLGEEESPEREAGGGATRPQPMGCRGGRGRST